MADSCEMMLRDTKLPEIMAKEKPGLYKQIREWIANFVEKLRKAFTGVEARHEEARAMMQYAEEMQQIWDNALAGAVRNAEAASGSETVSENVKYSLREFEDGTKYVDVKTDQDAFNGLTPEEMTSKAREIIKSRFAGKVVGNSNRAFVNNASANEYAYPSRFIKDEQVKEAKMRAAPELDNLIEAGRNYRTAADGRDGHVHKNATGGFTYFDVTFKVGDEYFDGVINIENNKNGRKFKDITKIRNATEDIISSYGKNPKSKFLSDTSMISISRDNENGNTKYSMRERDEDLQKKYPRLNLNEDISDLDGVPAIELTDGSILPIKDRERYRTHVSFIEGNRIDVDDLRSGGWIGNGVYDASFTSDTARYIEQQQAKKRVAELRGVPYDQFENGNTRYSMRERDDRQAAIQRELNQLKGEKKDLLNANAEYAAAVEQRRYAETFTERVAASKALKAAEAKVDTAEIDARIEMLQNESAELREQERAEYNAAKEKYSGAKTKGYSQYADTRTRELDEEYSRAVTARDETKMQELVLEAAERAMPNSVIRDENGKLKPVYQLHEQ